MLGLLEVHMMDQSDSAKCFQGLFAIFWMKIISPTLKVEEILCKAQKRLIMNHQMILHGKKKSEETEGHLEKIPVPTQRISQTVSPKGVPSYGGISSPGLCLAYEKRSSWIRRCQLF